MSKGDRGSERLLIEFQALDFQELGLGGMPIHKRFSEVKRLLAHHLDKAHSDLFATPYYGDAAEPAGWNASGDGVIRPMGSDTEKAGECLSEQIHNIRGVIDILKSSLLESDLRSAELLSLAMTVPNRGFVLAVGDLPRLGGWGYIDPRTKQTDALDEVVSQYQIKPEEKTMLRFRNSDTQNSSGLPDHDDIYDPDLKPRVLVGWRRYVYSVASTRWLSALIISVIVLSGLYWGGGIGTDTQKTAPLTISSSLAGCWTHQGLGDGNGETIVRVLLELCIHDAPKESKMSIYEDGTMKCTAPVTALQANDQVQIALNDSAPCEQGDPLQSFDVDCSPPASRSMDCSLKWRDGRIEVFSLRQVI